MATCAELLEPTRLELRRQVLEAPAIFSTETDIAKLTPSGWLEHYSEQVAEECQDAVSRLLARLEG